MMIIIIVVLCVYILFFFFKQKTAYEMRISDWSSDVCSSDLIAQTLPPFFDRERTNAEIGQVAPGTTTPRQLPIEPKPLTIRQDIGVALVAVAQNHAIG